MRINIYYCQHRRPKSMERTSHKSLQRLREGIKIQIQTKSKKRRQRRITQPTSHARRTQPTASSQQQ